MITTKMSVTWMIPNRNEIPFLRPFKAVDVWCLQQGSCQTRLTITWIILRHIDRIWRKALAETVRQRRANKTLPSCTILNEKKRKLNVELLKNIFLVMYKRALSFIISNSILCLFFSPIYMCKLEHKMYE